MECRIQNFKDLRVWKESHILVLAVYRVTKKFPDDEKFALVNQIRRFVVSVSSNIVEGFGRNTSKDKIQFYGIARGSLLELESQLIISKDLGYLTESEFGELDQQINTVGRMMSGLIKSAPSRG